MPTTVTKVIGTGGDYTTIAAWEAALPSNLVSADELHVGECKNEVFSETVTIAGQTTDATRYVHLTCQSGASFSDNASVRSNALRYNTANGMALAGNIPLTVSTNYTRVTGLQLTNGSAYGRVLQVTATNCLIQKCVMAIGAGGDSGSPGLSLAAGSVVANCLVQGHASGPNENAGAAGQGELRNCTILSPGSTSIRTGVTSSYSNLKLVNCAVFGFATAYSGTAAGGSSHNASDSATTFGTSNQSSLTYASQFVSTTNDFRAVDTGSLKNGTPDATYAPDDISGQSRDATTPYIGCWEVSSADTTPPTLSSRAVPSGGTTLTATLSESGCGPASGTGGFTLGGTAATVSSWAISGTTLTLTLSGLVYSGETVTLSYARASTTDDIEDAAGNFLADFSNASVTNNSTQTTTLAAGTASFVSSGSAGIVVTATDASGGATPYAYQWQRNEDGGSYSNISNGGGVSGATTLTLTDGSATTGILYGYRLVYTDDDSDTATSNAVTAQIYSGGPLEGGGCAVFGNGVFA